MRTVKLCSNKIGQGRCCLHFTEVEVELTLEYFRAGGAEWWDCGCCEWSAARWRWRFCPDWRSVAVDCGVSGVRLCERHCFDTCILDSLLACSHIHRGGAVLNCHPAVGCHYFPPGLQLPSQPQSITAPWLVPSYTAWWQRHIGVNNLPKVVTQLCPE